jgi:hypothetical protein
MELQTSGMEFASEMVIKSTFKSLRITEVPITLHKDGRSRPPHLKPWRDGWRHLRFMLVYSPQWLFLTPGLVLSALGILVAVPLSFTALRFIIGIQLVAFAFFTKVFAIAEGLLPEDTKFARIFRFFTLEKGLVGGLAVLLAGMILLGRAGLVWEQADFGVLPYADNLRRLIPAAALVVAGSQTIFSSFFMSVLGLKTASRKPPTLPDHGR